MFTRFVRRFLGHRGTRERRAPRSGAVATVQAVKLRKNVFGYWLIINARDPRLAWSGSSWVHLNQYENGIEAQVSNLPTKDEAVEYAASFGFEIHD